MKYLKSLAKVVIDKIDLMKKIFCKNPSRSNRKISPPLCIAIKHQNFQTTCVLVILRSDHYVELGHDLELLR